MEPRCHKCNKKLADYLDGTDYTLVRTCRYCKTVNVFKNPLLTLTK